MKKIILLKKIYLEKLSKKKYNNLSCFDWSNMSASSDYDLNDIALNDRRPLCQVRVKGLLYLILLETCSGELSCADLLPFIAYNGK